MWSSATGPYGAFSTWFSNSIVAGADSRTQDALNLSLIVAGSDKSFGAWVSYLQTFAIPWTILCDGPVLSPTLTACYVSI